MSDIKATVGREIVSGLYYEVLGDGSGYPYPVLFIHGGASFGTTWRSSFDGGAGWADRLAADGYECWVTDWPGSGRSGYRDLLTLDYQDVVDGYIRLVRDIIGRPVVVMPHSMGGAVAWRLIEEIPELIAGVVGIACAYPANIQQKSEVTSDDGNVVHLTFVDTGVSFEVDRRTPYTYGDSYINDQAIAGSTQFDPEWLPILKAGVGSMSPRMLLQRVGAIPGMPVIESVKGFEGKRIRLLAGSEDPAHTLELERRTAQLLTSWGADAEVVWLADEGLEGNGHYLPRERNYLEVLDIVTKQLDCIVAR
ncbi:alpha/beta hydrolase [Cryobacterium sp. Y50]|uniref:alpha/beta hydrolase n=1 Tax=Cryobacterium sp. Y50 TaxID=2048286 RepID=UPI000CE342DE|nr:alpha/beta hydrolase [Cryobacterium sp. Y50]